ncbi:MAG: restriction endonuclease subunit S [Chthoniobacterales bacterium]
MTTETSQPRRAYAVRFSELDRWKRPDAVFDAARLPRDWQVVRLGTIARQFSSPEKVDAAREYKLAGVKWYAEGVFHRETVKGTDTSATHLTPLVPGALIYNRLFAWKSSFAVVQPEHVGMYVSGEFPQFEIDSTAALADFIYLFATLPKTIEAVNARSVGSAAVSRNRFKEEEFLSLEIPLPPLATQQEIVKRWHAAQFKVAETLSSADDAQHKAEANFLGQLGFDLTGTAAQPLKFFAARFSDTLTWTAGSVFKRLTAPNVRGGKYPVARGTDILLDVRHGCSAAPSSVRTGLEVLKISAVTRGEFVPSERKFAPDQPRYRKAFDLRRGDLLLCRTNGTLAYVGMSALVPEDQHNLIFPDKVIRVRVNERVIPDFLWLVLHTPPMRAQIELAARTAVGNYAIGGADIWKFEFPVPPLETQRELATTLTRARAAAAKQRTRAAQLSEQLASEIEQRILGACDYA